MKCKFSVIGVSETWLQDGCDTSLYNIPSYSFITSSRSDSRGGGVGLYIHSSLSYSVLDGVTIANCESLFIEASINNKNIVIGIVYRKPNTNINEFVESFDLFLNEMSDKNKKCIIHGDFNIDYNQNNSAYQRYASTLHSNNFQQVIDVPTRLTFNSNTLIDHCLVNFYDCFIESGTIETDISDHFATFSIFKKLNHVLTDESEYYTYDFSNFDPISYKNDLMSADWDNVYQATDPNTAYSSFYKTFHAISTKHVPIRRICTKSKKLIKPWLTKGLLNSIKTKHKLFSKTKRQPTNFALKDRYVSYRNRLTKLLKHAEKSYYINKISISTGKNNNKTWGTINEILNKTASSGGKIIPNKITISQNPVQYATTGNTIAEAFNSYFTGIGTDLASKIRSSTNFSTYLKKIAPRIHSF